MPLDFRAPQKKLEDLDLPRIGSEIGVGEDELHAVLEIEAAGSSADRQGRLKMLFEPHVFYRNLKGAKRDAAVRAGLAYPNWRSGYPADSYPRLEKALAIDETAALKACSWGLPQILGENHKAAGYATPQAMVAAFCEDEENHLQAMVAFIRSKGLHRALVRHDWAAFAYGYNGAAYARHNYHGRLAAAFARWQKIKDTPWDGTPRSVTVGEATIDVTPQGETPVVRVDPVPPPTPIALPAPDAAPPKRRDGIVSWVLAAIVAAALAAWNWAQEHLPEIFLGGVGLVVLALVIFRLLKGRWPWTGHSLPLSSLPSLQSSAVSLEWLSGRLAQLSGASPAAPSPAPSAPIPPPRRSSKSLARRKRPSGSRGSKPSTRTRSSSKRKSKSRR